MASTSTVEEVDVDDDDLEETAAGDAHRGEEMDRAASMFECINMPQKKCHFVCKLQNGQPCISQFRADN